MTPEEITIGPALMARTFEVSGAFRIDLKAGKVEILDGLSPDEAGRAAVAAFAKYWPEAFRAARLEALEEAAKIAEGIDFAGEPELPKIVAAKIRLRAKAT